jgi:hypothetical protein
MARLDTCLYLDRYKRSGEFPAEGPFSKLPLPTDALSYVKDPYEWVCFPENVVRLYLSSIDNFWIVGVGDYQYPTLYQKAFSTLDDACSWMAKRPELLSRKWLEEEEFESIMFRLIRIR